jgi:hypothetical protein
MPKAEWIESTLTLQKQEINVRTGLLRVPDLRFYPENPRLYSIMYDGTGEPSQKAILEKLSSMEHVKQLRQSIISNNGLIDPIIVRDGDFVVLEGNSRLAAYKLLYQQDPIHWGKVKSTLLPSDIPEPLVFALLGEYHIIGKKDWAPFEQAGYLYRRNRNHHADPAEMAKEMGLSVKMVSHLIRVYAFMVEHHDDDVGRWSYYDEYLKHYAIRRAREELPELDEVFVKKVKSHEIPRAVDVRDKFTKIAAVGGKTLHAFVSEKGNFERCYERSILRGADNVWYKRLGKFREQLAEPDLKHVFLEMSEDQLKKCLFEMKKISSILERLGKSLL